MASVSEAVQKLGELFITGFEGTELSDDTSMFLSQAGVGGVILFSHNYKSPEQLVELTNQLQDGRADLPFWIAVDQEGGRVQRFKEPFTRLPTAADVGKANSPRLTFELAELMAKELSSVGINLNFAPVADILTNSINKAIGDRAFGNDEGLVTKMVTAVVRGHVTNGVQACVKHFPGHGECMEDSHEVLPEVATSLDTLRKREFRPFVRTFKSRCGMVMVSHIKNKNIDPDLPASLSSKTLRDLLKKDMRYSRLIVSDDMEMKAITNNFEPKKAALMAIEAGCDILVYRTEAGARTAYQSVLNNLEEGKISPDLIVDAADKIRAYKKETIANREPASAHQAKNLVGIPEHKEVVDKILEAAK